MTPAAASPKSRSSKILIGCAIALALGVAIGLALIFAGGYWLTRPGHQSQTVVVVGPQSVGQVRLEDVSADPGVRELLSEFVRAMREADVSASALPGWLQGLRSMQADQSAQQLEMWLPSEATLSLEPQSGPGAWVAAFNFRSFVRPIAVMLQHMLKQDRGVRVVAHGGQEVFVLREGVVLCFAESTLLVGQPLEAVTGALDRVPAPGSPAAPASTPAGPPGSWDLRGGFDRPEETRALARVLAHAARALDLDTSVSLAWPGTEAQLERARFGLDVKTGDELRACIEWVYASPAAAQAAEAAWAALVAAAQERVARDGMVLSVTREVQDRSVRLQVGVTGIKAALPRRLARMTRESHERRPPRLVR